MTLQISCLEGSQAKYLAGILFRHWERASLPTYPLLLPWKNV